ncbi:MAG: hypothetical protein KY464_18995, partial [Gemmatimonadetes bacterium]|nr:hypothetical protein [Gemmatimonadota bacterium]
MTWFHLSHPPKIARALLRAAHASALLITLAVVGLAGCRDASGPSRTLVLTIDPDTATLTVGTSRQLTAVVRDTAGIPLAA